MARVITRRKLLAGIAAAGILSGCGNPVASRFLSGMTRWNQDFQSLLFSPTRLAPEPSAAELTPERDFPVYFISDMMPIAPPNWMLAISGLVAHPTMLTIDQLRQMPMTDLRIRHHCVEGWSAVASWQGVKLSDLAQMVGAAPEARFVEFRSFDNGYWSSWDRASALHPQTILAYGMNGHALYPEHGAPLRLYSPVKLGYKTVKYLTQVNFLPHPTGGYWEDQGYEWFAGT
ncbi:MAG: molybdopterin-dependent oxidoreductase [Candidatus Binataceae bacterium]